MGGDVKRRLGLNTSDDYCTRDEFILLTLVLQGKRLNQTKAQRTSTEEAQRPTNVHRGWAAGLGKS